MSTNISGSNQEVSLLWCRMAIHLSYELLQCPQSLYPGEVNRSGWWICTFNNSKILDSTGFNQAIGASWCAYASNSWPQRLLAFTHCVWFSRVHQNCQILGWTWQKESCCHRWSGQYTSSSSSRVSRCELWCDWDAFGPASSSAPVWGKGIWMGICRSNCFSIIMSKIMPATWAVSSFFWAQTPSFGWDEWYTNHMLALASLSFLVSGDKDPFVSFYLKVKGDQH